ncbi:SPP1 family PHD finger domain-containing protein [Sporobolomyces koalae]|uniref:SPP1 family PHD finger domain-containing protein n=1 Tax=Sporobolomyces koalae TaxID=500713 RepID=UPI00317C4508
MASMQVLARPARMNFSNLLNPDALDQHDAPYEPASRMGFDYLTSEHNLSPTGVGSPAFYSTPSEFVADSDTETVATGAPSDVAMLDVAQFNHLNQPFAPASASVTSQSQLYNAFHQPARYPTFDPYANHSAYHPTPSPAPPALVGAFAPDVFSPLQPYQHHVTPHVGMHPTGVDPLETTPTTGDEKPKKASKAKPKGKSKAKSGDSIDLDDSSSSTKASTATKPRANKPKAPAKAKRNVLLATSAHSSPAPSPGPSALANEVRFDSQDPDDQFDRESFTHHADSVQPEQELKPLTTHHLRSVVEPSVGAGLSASFRTYVPPRIGPNGTVVSDSEEEDEDVVRKRAQAKRSAALAAKGKSRARQEEEAREEADDRLYCVCRELYDPERLMIACDQCEEWYHVDCVGIPDDSVELVDQFFCPPCQTKNHQVTTWLTACARPTCRKPAVALSKYCSDYCGISVVSARLELLKLSNGTNPSTFWSRVEGARRKEAQVADAATQPHRTEFSTTTTDEFQDAEDARTLSTLETKLVETNSRRAGLTASIEMVEKRLEYLQIAIRRWEALCQATADELASAGIDQGGPSNGNDVEETKPTTKSRGKKRNRTKKKGPVAATSRPEAQCGLDVRLVYDDETWKHWVESTAPGPDKGGLEGEEEGGHAILAARERGDDQTVLEMALEMLSGVCLETRKKCERHTGWQKLRQADFQVEKAVLNRRLDRLNTLSSSLESQISLHQQATAFRRSNRNRTASPSRLIPIDDFMQEQAALQPSPKATNGRGRGTRRSTSPVVNRNSISGTTTSSTFNRSDFVVSGGGTEDADNSSGSFDIPAELLPFLSRAEIAKLRAQKR